MITRLSPVAYRLPEVKYYLSNAGTDVALESQAQVTGTRWRVEDLIHDAMGHMGFTDTLSLHQQTVPALRR